MKKCIISLLLLAAIGMIACQPKPHYTGSGYSASNEVYEQARDRKVVRGLGGVLYTH